jgi:hypothetical protein
MPAYACARSGPVMLAHIGMMQAMHRKPDRNGSFTRREGSIDNGDARFNRGANSMNCDACGVL